MIKKRLHRGYAYDCLTCIGNMNDLCTREIYSGKITLIHFLLGGQTL